MDKPAPTVTPDGISLKAFARPERGDLAIWCYRVFPGTGDVARGEMTFAPWSDRGVDLQPAMPISYDVALMLANSLWDAGIRPVQSSGSVGQVEAMRAHIETLERRLSAADDQIGRMQKLLSDWLMEFKSKPAPAPVPHMPKILNFSGVGSSAPIRCLCCGGRDPYDNLAEWPAGEVQCGCSPKSRQLARVPVPAAPADPGPKVQG